MTDVPHHDELPLPDYDHLTVAAVQQRIRSLDLGALEAVIAYEEAHGHRLPVLQVLEARHLELSAGRPTSDGDPTEVTPEAPAGEPSGSFGSAAATPGPPVNPPSQGDPTNPAQPR
jgi:hypothetical protein